MYQTGMLGSMIPDANLMDYSGMTPVFPRVSRPRGDPSQVVPTSPSGLFGSALPKLLDAFCSLVS